MMQNKPSPSELRPFDAGHFRKALSQFATGVTVITTRTDDGKFLGLTASSFNSVSLEPPLVLWSLATAANSMPVFASCSHYAINVLSAEQAWIAQQFASKRENRFEGIQFSLSPAGLPVIDGAAAWFECQNRSRYPEGDHVIFVGQVSHCQVEVQDALIYHSGQFMKAHKT